MLKTTMLKLNYLIVKKYKRNGIINAICISQAKYQECPKHFVFFEYAYNSYLLKTSELSELITYVVDHNEIVNVQEMCPPVF